jgi:hypothetical protein
MKRSMSRTAAAGGTPVRWGRHAFGRLVLSAGMTAGWPVSGPAAEHRTEAAEIRLPPLATVETRDVSGTTWEMDGWIAGNLRVAAKTFSRCLTGQGWRTEMSPMRMTRELVLLKWQRGDRKLLLLLRSEGAGRTHFSLGRYSETEDGRGRSAVAPGA